jgi:hypothetical protein
VNIEARVDKMVITYSTSKTRRPPRKIGDRKMIKGVMHVCRQVYSKREGAYLSTNGKPDLEWVPV